jgi:hypothetical protein
MNLLTKIRLIPIRFWGNIYFRKLAIRKAKRLHLSEPNPNRRTRYRVFFIERRYQVLTRQDIQRAKHEKRFASHVNSTNMQPHCFFDTDSL